LSVCGLCKSEIGGAWDTITRTCKTFAGFGKLHTY
jgi:hypothetical protein